MLDFKGSQSERDIILWGVRWYGAYPISYRQLEEMMQERGVEVDHFSLNRWVLKFTPALVKAFRQRKRSVGTGGCMTLGQPLDETYIRVRDYNRDHETDIGLRQAKYLNNIAEQDH